MVKKLLFQTYEWTRVLIVLIAQSIVAAVFIILSYKVLRRHRTWLSMICSGIFISIALAFIINLIYFPLTINPLVYILYIITFYLLLIAMIFILLFNLVLIRSKFEFTRKKQVILFFIYAVVSLLILILPGGITIDESTNWRPTWSLTIMVIVLVFTIVFLIIPSTYFSLRIYNSFEEKLVKKKWAYFLFGYLGLVVSFIILLFFYINTDPIIRTILSILNLIIVPSGLLMYMGLGRQLE